MRKLDSDHDKLIRTEEKLDALSCIVYEIKDNYLAHLSANIESIEKKVDSINVKLAMWSGGIVVLVWLAERFIK